MQDRDYAQHWKNLVMVVGAMIVAWCLYVYVENAWRYLFAVVGVLNSILVVGYVLVYFIDRHSSALVEVVKGWERWIGNKQNLIKLRGRLLVIVYVLAAALCFGSMYALYLAFRSWPDMDVKSFLWGFAAASAAFALSGIARLFHYGLNARWKETMLFGLTTCAANLTVLAFV